MLSKIKNSKNNEDGFTLIELLIVVVIIGILAAIAIPIFLNQQKAALAGTVKSDVRNTLSNVALYLTKSPNAASSELDVVKSGNSPATGTGVGNFLIVNTAENVVRVNGGSTNYRVTGRNPDIAGTYLYDSTTGKFTDTMNF